MPPGVPAHGHDGQEVRAPWIKLCEAPRQQVVAGAEHRLDREAVRKAPAAVKHERVSWAGVDGADDGERVELPAHDDAELLVAEEAAV